jgi:hypothetical protein
VIDRRKFIQQGTAATLVAPTGLRATIQPTETCPLGHLQAPQIFGNLMVAFKLNDGQKGDYGDQVTANRIRQCATCNVLYMGP